MHRIILIALMGSSLVLVCPTSAQQIQAEPPSDEELTTVLATLSEQGYAARRYRWSGTLAGGHEYELPAALCVGNDYGMLLRFAADDTASRAIVINEEGEKVHTTTAEIDSRTLLLKFPAEYNGIYRLVFSVPESQQPLQAQALILYK